MRREQERVLVYQLGSIGDTVVSLPAIAAVRRHFGPQARISLLHEVRQEVKTSPADLLVDGPEIDQFVGYPFGATAGRKLASAIPLWWRLRKERFDAVVYLAPSERTSAQVNRDALFFRWCGIRRRVGFRAFPRKVLYPVDGEGRPGRVMHEALCRLERLRLDGIDVSRESDFSHPFLRIPERALTEARQWLDRTRRQKERTLVAICPGSKQPANIWPVERFVEIGRRLIQRERYELLVVGGRTEAATGDRMVSAWGQGLNGAGRFSVAGSAALLSQCAFCIGLDTGTTHLAAAAGTPCVALYGERDNPGRFEPLGEGHTVIRIKVPCAGCRLIETPCPVLGHPCMTGIEVEAVWRAVLQAATRVTERQYVGKDRDC